jgi:hypothetical protein
MAGTLRTVSVRVCNNQVEGATSIVDHVINNRVLRSQALLSQ